MNDRRQSLPLPALQAAGSGRHVFGSTDDMSWQYSDPRIDPAQLIEAVDHVAVRAGLARRLHPEWFDRAACRQPEHADRQFVSNSIDEQARCLAVCSSCDVMAECREYADLRADTFAVMGAETPTTRRARWRIRGREGGTDAPA